jgi:septal ring factor EnvC (AmiA/AmiB activator)
VNSALDSNVVTAFVAGSFVLASTAIPFYFKNRRSMRKVSAEEFIEGFMKRQEQEIAQKNELIKEMEQTCRKHESTIKDLEVSMYKKDAVINQLKALTKELRNEIKKAKEHSSKLKVQLEQMKDDYKSMTGKKLK